MYRIDIRNRLIDPSTFPFWVPVISHYQPAPGGGASIDAARMLAHARQIYPFTRCWMLGGTTGDGWALNNAQFAQLLDYATMLPVHLDRPALIIGALRPTTDEVLERIAGVKRWLGISEQAPLSENLEALSRYHLVGVTVCAPVGDYLSQDQIYQHLARICAESRLPIVLYQLPQVTRNLIAPETFRSLLAEFENIILFKDSGGGDEVARSGPVDPGVMMVRGAEGGYVEALKTEGGGYDGWLLSTGNAFAAQLAEIVIHHRRGEPDKALGLSRRLGNWVQQVFDVARQAPKGNAFSNANRAVDHLLAYGRNRTEQPLPLLQDGSRLPADLITQIETVLRPTGWLPEDGYLKM